MPTSKEDPVLEWFLKNDSYAEAITDPESWDEGVVERTKARVESLRQLVIARENAVAKKADLEGTIEAAEQIWAIYNAPSREPGQKMFDFDKWMPGQIEDWKRQLADLQSQPTMKEPFGLKIKVDERVPEDSVRFDHPDGRVEGFTMKDKEE